VTDLLRCGTFDVWDDRCIQKLCSQNFPNDCLNDLDLRAIARPIHRANSFSTGCITRFGGDRIRPLALERNGCSSKTVYDFGVETG